MQTDRVDMSRLHAFVLCCAGTARPSEPKDSAEIALWPQGGLNQNWSVIWVVHCLAILASPVCPQTKADSTSAISNQPRSSGLKEGPVFLAHWLQAKVRKSHNIMILNVGPALFVAALFNCFRIILNPVLKEGMFPVKTPSPTQLT